MDTQPHMQPPTARKRNANKSVPAQQTSPGSRSFAIALLLVGAFCAGMGQTITFSILPPIAREIGLADQQVVFIYMISAACWATCMPRWGQRSDNGRRKPFILIGLMGFAVSMVLFGLSIQAGLAGLLSGAPLYILIVAMRSLYGLFGSAGPPAAQGYIADRTNTFDRTAGIASFAAAFGFGAMLGPGFGAVASVFGRTAPFFAIAFFAFVMTIAVYLFLPERMQPKKKEQQTPIRLGDKRIRHFMIIALLSGSMNAIMIQTIGFYFMDVLGFSIEMAPQIVGVGLTAAAMAALFSQIVIVQRFRLEPRTLLRTGPVLLVAGNCLVWSLPQLGPVFFGLVLSGFGIGMMTPGFNAAASLAVSPDEQGGAIGITSASSAAGFIVAPLIGINLYQWIPQTPYIFTTLLGIGLWVFTMRSNAVAASSPSQIAAAQDDTQSPLHP